MTSPVVEEAARLLEALQSWAGSASGAGSAGVPPESTPPECRACPVCQLLRAVRGVRPEVVEHLAGASAELLAALRAALEASPTGQPTGQPADRRVEHIDIRE